MALNFEIANGLHTAKGHVAHDSALDVPEKPDGVRMRELEEHNAILAERTAAATQRFADYENEIRVLQARLRQSERRNTSTTVSSPTPESPASEKPGISRFGSFMQRRNMSASGPSAREQELEVALAREQAARGAAEQKVKEVNAEIEELSASLFQQANEMVATERKENAVLKERLDALESAGGTAAQVTLRENERLKKKIRAFEQRDADRKRRLDRLEAAQQRIDRVKAMLLPP